MSKAKPAARRGAGASPRALMQGTRSLVMNGEIMIYGIIDSYDDFGDAIRAIDVMGSMVELADQPRLSVRINSPGGNVMEGLSIYNALRNAGKPVDVHVDAMAASIASVIAMAGDTITIADTGTIMIHYSRDRRKNRIFYRQNSNLGPHESGPFLCPMSATAHQRFPLNARSIRHLHATSTRHEMRQGMRHELPA